jgi:hypothetical protein
VNNIDLSGKQNVADRSLVRNDRPWLRAEHACFSQIEPEDDGITPVGVRPGEDTGRVEASGAEDVNHRRVIGLESRQPCTARPSRAPANVELGQCQLGLQGKAVRDL